MFDRREFAVGNVRLDRDLRRRRNGGRNRGACHRGNNGPHGDPGNINVVGNVSYVGKFDILRNAGHVGNVGNVRLRLDQHSFIFDSNVDVNFAHHAGRRRSNRNPIGILRNWQSWSWLRTGGTGAKRIAHYGECGEFSAIATNDVPCITCDGKHCDVWDHRNDWDRGLRDRWDRERRDYRNVDLGANAETIFHLRAKPAMNRKVIVPAALLTALHARRAILRLLSGRSAMRPLLIVAAAWPLLCGSPAFAQVGTAMPPLGVTSSLGTVPGAPVGTNGMPLGASLGVSPVANGVTGTITIPSTSSGAACATVATSPLGTFGSPATYDGGGMAMATGTTTPATATSGTTTTSGVSTSSGMLETSGLSGMCGAGSSSIAASSTPTSTSATPPGGSARAGVPLGSYEIGNLGVSPTAALPTTNVSPITGSVGSSAPSVPTMPTVSSPATASSTIP